MKKIAGFVPFVFAVAFLVACGDDGNDFVSRPSDDSSSSVCEDCDDVRSSSSSVTPQSSDSETSVSSSSSAKSSSLDQSSSSVTLATPCRTETEDNCEYGSVTDSRDGQTYKTVTIGTQTWMAENLNYETADSYCYNDSAKYCAKYGRLYTWAAAMDSAGTWSANGKGCGYDKTCSSTYPVRGVCPSGWHLPSKTEFETLFETVAVGGEFTEGNALKASSGWYNSQNGTDAFGFSALPAGYYRNIDLKYYYEGYNVYFWSSTENYSNDAYHMYLRYNGGSAYLNDFTKYYGSSVRCLKD